MYEQDLHPWDNGYKYCWQWELINHTCVLSDITPYMQCSSSCPFGAGIWRGASFHPINVRKATSQSCWMSSPSVLPDQGRVQTGIWAASKTKYGASIFSLFTRSGLLPNIVLSCKTFAKRHQRGKIQLYIYVIYACNAKWFPFLLSWKCSRPTIFLWDQLWWFASQTPGNYPWGNSKLQHLASQGLDYNRSDSTRARCYDCCHNVLAGHCNATKSQHSDHRIMVNII